MSEIRIHWNKQFVKVILSYYSCSVSCIPALLWWNYGGGGGGRLKRWIHFPHFPGKHSSHPDTHLTFGSSEPFWQLLLGIPMLKLHKTHVINTSTSSNVQWVPQPLGRWINYPGFLVFLFVKPFLFSYTQFSVKSLILNCNYLLVIYYRKNSYEKRINLSYINYLS